MDGLVALLTEDAWLPMPPLPLEYQGRELVGRFFDRGRSGRPPLPDGPDPGQRPAGVRRVRARPAGPTSCTPTGYSCSPWPAVRISAMTRFDNSVLSRFGLPRTLAG